jgi:YVTN family beta-propeller protein
VANGGSNNLTRIKKSDSTTTTIAVGNVPIGIAVDETYCWVANAVSNNCTRIKKSDLTTTNIAVGTHPRGVAVDETYCWVANWGSNNVTRIKKSDSTTTTIDVGRTPNGIAVDEAYVWVANSGSNDVTRIKKSDSSTTTIAVGNVPIGIAVDETYCWVANCNSNNVTRIKKADSTTTTIDVGQNPFGIAVDETYCWVANCNSNNVTRIKKSDSTTTTIDVGQNPFGIAVDETYVWVTNRSSHNVTRIKKADSTTTTIDVGRNPHSQGDMTGYAYASGSVPISIKPEVITLTSEADLTKIIKDGLTDLRDSSRRRKAEAVLVGLKEKAARSLVEAFNDEDKKEEETYQTLLKEIKELIPRLGAEEWAEREEAQTRLEAIIDHKAIPPLKEAKEKDPDPEIRMRANRALSRIEEQGYSELELKRRGFISSLLNIIGNIGSIKQPALMCFVRSLSDNDSLLRRLSYRWLKKLTGKELPFEPAKSPPEEAFHIKSWESLIEKEFSE